MEEVAFIDTSAWIALVNKGSPTHGPIREAIEAAGQIVTSSFVVDETVTTAEALLGKPKGIEVGRILFGPLRRRVLWIGPDDVERAWLLYVGRPDKAYSFTDCTSFELMRRSGVTRAITLDEHFAQEGFLVASALLDAAKKRSKRERR